MIARSLSLSGTHHDLTDADCPLLYQCRWADPDKQRFELRCRNEGVIKVCEKIEEVQCELKNVLEARHSELL